jgi:tRNA(fMet)-specific endonuclease VapC
MSGTNRSFLIDTNAAIARIKQDAALIQLLDTAEDVYVSSTVLGELFYGAEKSAKVKDNRANVRELIADVTVLSCDADTAYWYGRVRYIMQRKGRPIPDNDLWIAAIAFQHSLTLVTRDAHFKEINGLSVETW